jgi:hypothetical protein
MNKEQFVNMFGAEPGANLFLDAPGAKRALEEIPDHNTKKNKRIKNKKELVQADESNWAAVCGGIEKEALGMIKLLSGFDAQLSAEDATSLPIQASMLAMCCVLWMGLCTGCLHACFCCRPPSEISRRACVSSKTQRRALARMLFQDCVSAWRELASSSCRQQCF